MCVDIEESDKVIIFSFTFLYFFWYSLFVSSSYFLFMFLLTSPHSLSRSLFIFHSYIPFSYSFLYSFFIFHLTPLHSLSSLPLSFTFPLTHLHSLFHTLSISRSLTLLFIPSLLSLSIPHSPFSPFHFISFFLSPQSSSKAAMRVVLERT